eukprot:TRINITY_DN16554_c0_g1_i3.p1 TRINITY_DN16554_c0_g1~~TRINITY_DN16554_c0_g1_i3.p1  ORF type:complete len:247 (+),score=51.39 TRINITY_DN16554_c0_g1_i3:28-768(+)
MAFATMAHSPGFKRSQMRSRVSLFALLTCLLATYTICEVTFFDFFGKPPDTPSTRETGLKTASYGQIMTLKRLRKSQEVDSRWLSYCEAANASAAEVAKLPMGFVQTFLLEPCNHGNTFLKTFVSEAKLSPVIVPDSVDDDEEDFGGFMDSNRFGLVKSEKWLKAEKRLLAERVQQYLSSPENVERWQRYCKREEETVDPDDEESDEVRQEMASRSVIGRPKTALESWYDAQAGKAPPPSKRKWGV